jgi:hypothetical protein
VGEGRFFLFVESGSLEIGKICCRKALQGHSKRGSFCHTTTQALADRNSQVSAEQLRTACELFGNFLSSSKNPILADDFSDGTPL